MGDDIFSNNGHSNAEISAELRGALSNGVTFKGGPVEIAGTVDSYQVQIKFCDSGSVNEEMLKELAGIINAEGFGSNSAVYDSYEGYLSLSASNVTDKLDAMQVIAETVAVKLGITFEEKTYDIDNYFIPPEANCSEEKHIASHDHRTQKLNSNLGFTS